MDDVGPRKKSRRFLLPVEDVEFLLRDEMRCIGAAVGGGDTGMHRLTSGREPREPTPQPAPQYRDPPPQRGVLGFKIAL